MIIASELEQIQGVPIGVVPSAPRGKSPSVLIAIMGPYPGHYEDGRTTLDDIKAMVRRYGKCAVPAIIPGMISPEEEAQIDTVPGIRLRGMTAMRNWACEQAVENGYDYLLLIENDVKCFPTLLNKLLTLDKPIVIPTFHFPSFPPADFLNAAPRPYADQVEPIELQWACHSIVLFRRDALETIKPVVFMGYTTEGADHIHWQNHDQGAWMPMDVTVDVMSVPKGEAKLVDGIPFKVHFRNGRRCEGPVYEHRRTQNMGLYRCSQPACDYEMFFRAPTKTRMKVSDLVPPDIQMDWTWRKELWEVRSRYYQNLDWANSQGYLDRVINSVTYRPDEMVLDAGTGPGTIAHALAFRVGKVVGMDLSPHMLELARKDAVASEEFHEGDVRHIPFPTGFYNKVFARMVFHSLVEEGDTLKAAKECYRVLQDGGTFILSEGIPPHPDVEEWYTEMFKHKADRVTFSVASLEKIVRDAGFKDVKTILHTIPESSIRNWLANSGLPAKQQAVLMAIHQNMPEVARRYYQAEFLPDGDVLIHMKFAIVTGRKP